MWRKHSFFKWNYSRSINMFCLIITCLISNKLIDIFLLYYVSCCLHVCFRFLNAHKEQFLYNMFNKVWEVLTPSKWRLTKILYPSWMLCNFSLYSVFFFNITCTKLWPFYCRIILRLYRLYWTRRLIKIPNLRRFE